MMEYLGWIVAGIAIVAEWWLVMGYLPNLRAYKEDGEKLRDLLPQVESALHKAHDIMGERTDCAHIIKFAHSLYADLKVSQESYGMDRNSYEWAIEQKLLAALTDRVHGAIQANVEQIFRNNTRWAEEYKKLLDEAAKWGQQRADQITPELIAPFKEKLERLEGRQRLLEQDIEFVNVVSGRNKYKGG